MLCQRCSQSNTTLKTLTSCLIQEYSSQHVCNCLTTDSKEWAYIVLSSCIWKERTDITQWALCVGIVKAKVTTEAVGTYKSERIRKGRWKNNDGSKIDESDKKMVAYLAMYKQHSYDKELAAWKATYADSGATTPMVWMSLFCSEEKSERYFDCHYKWWGSEIEK